MYGHFLYVKYFFLSLRNAMMVLSFQDVEFNYILFYF